jgi:hypothetical protein
VYCSTEGRKRRPGPPGNLGAASRPAGVAVWARRRDRGCEPREGSRVRCERGKLNLVPFFLSFERDEIGSVERASDETLATELGQTWPASRAKVFFSEMAARNYSASGAMGKS